MVVAVLGLLTQLVQPPGYADMKTGRMIMNWMCKPCLNAAPRAAVDVEKIRMELSD